MIDINSDNSFEYQKLSQEEQDKRGILGRLVGKIADWKHPTRNSRYYTRELWENVFKDSIFQEKIQNRLCFGEIQHPLDGRTEIDPQKIAICLAETPKIAEDGFVYGVFDILNTNCGQILKTMLDYGSKIGVSSRGEGDIINGDQVDPDTYNCICWDAVIIPAVKAARPEYVTESLQNKKSLNESLKQLIKKANAADKAIIESSLKELGINLNEDTNYVELTKVAEKELDGKYGKITNNKGLRKALKTAIDSQAVDDVMTIAKLIQKYDPDYTKKHSKINELATKPMKVNTDVSGDSIIEEPAPEQIELTDVAPDQADTIVPEEPQVPSQPPVTNEKAPVSSDDLEEESYSNNQHKANNINENINKNEDGNSVALIINTLQEALKNKQDVETKVLKLNEKLSVCYAKEAKQQEVITQLQEDLTKAEGLVEFKTQAQKQKVLLEQANQSISTLNHKRKAIIEKYNALVDDYNAGTDVIKSLNESITKYEAEIAKIRKQNTKLVEDLAEARSNLSQNQETYSKQLEKSNTLVEKYKKVANHAINKYIDSQAVKLDVTSAEIKKRLPENYTFNDIDSICESLQEYKRGMNKLPFKTFNPLYENMNVEITGKKKVDPLLKEQALNVDDEIDDDLRVLAKM